MVTTLYLVRHGVTVGGEERRYKGSIDVPLAPEGLVQARSTGYFLQQEIARHNANGQADSGAVMLYTSPLSRARKTAEAISECFGVLPVVHDDLRERHFGVWEGLSFNEIRERYRNAFQAWADNPLEHTPTGGESTRDIERRTAGVLDKLLEEHQGKSVIVVAHGGVNRVLICRIMGLPLEHIFRIEQDNAAVSIIEFWEDYPVLKLMNYSPWKYA
ncbi:MAG TPA: histidine phosphatase family protein [Dissulfurispiraceae bacterium]|nr:histidine phosphatase family protein [Dissulfurispiraceae bacterium]